MSTHCPTCGAPESNPGDLFCEADGARLVAGGASAPGACSGCGAVNSDGGDGYCSGCGHRLVASSADVALEGAAREALLCDRELASLLEAAAALSLAQSALTPGALVEAMVLGLRAAEALGGAGLAWAPEPGDLRSRSGSLALARIRVAKHAGPLDVQPVLAAFAGAALPEPAVRGSARLVCLLSRASLGRVPSSLVHAQSELSLIRKEDLSLSAPVPAYGAATDAGLHHARNEDAWALRSEQSHGEPFLAIGLCDGVSSARDSDRAAQAGSKAACDALARFALATHKGDAEAAMRVAIREAHQAVCALPHTRGASDAPGATLVAALVRPGHLTVGWVGDSRAYWLGPAGNGLLTRDHSWLNEVMAKGKLTEAEALRSPDAHALTRCLGPLEEEDSGEPPQPDVKSFSAPPGSRLLLCTDGLWNYFPRPEDLAELLRSGPKDPRALARLLINHALARGGRDNVTAIVVDLP